MGRTGVAAALIGLIGCGYSPPAQIKAVRGDWIADGTGPGNFRVLILDPSLDQDFKWYESHVYTNGRLTEGSSGNFKWEQGRISLKLATSYEEFEIGEATADALVLRKGGTEIRFRRLTEADYDRVDWTVSKIDRLKARGGPRSK